MNAFQVLESKLTEALPLLREAASKLAELKQDESWPSFLVENPAQADLFEITSASTLQMAASIDVMMQGLKKESEAMSIYLEAFKTARGEIGKPPKVSPGLN